MMIVGNAWKYGSNIDTDQLAPINSYRGKDPEQGAVHCLESLDPDFAKNVKENDIFVAEDNMGIGSSREFAPLFLKSLGIRVVLARSFARIFYRNCFNLGLPALVCAETPSIKIGERLNVDPANGTILRETGQQLNCDPVPAHLMSMVDAGGLMAHLKKRFASG